MSGKRARSRRDRRRAPGSSQRIALPALAVTVLTAAWGYLTLRAIDLGAQARDGDPAGWWPLVMSALAAAACLYVALALVTRFARHIAAVRYAPGTGVKPAGRRIRARS